MKIVFFIYSMSIGGAERVTATLANHWASRGWNIVVVTMTNPSKQEYRLDPAVRRIALNLAKESTNSASRLWHNFQRLAAMRRVLVTERADVAIGMMATPSTLLPLAAFGLPTICIGAERTYSPQLPLGALWETLRRVSYGHLNCVVAQTEDAALWLRQHTDARRVVVIPNPLSLPLPVRAPAQSPSLLLGERDGRKTLLCVGRLAPEKRFHLAIAAFAQLAARHPKWRLVILGEGPLRAELETHAQALGVSDRVHLPGGVGNPGDWYEAADLFLLTSAFEGFPNSLLEAMAHALAAVSVDCNAGPRDIIQDGVTGVLVPQDDIAALCSALDQIMADDALREHLAQNAVTVRERFSLMNVATKWEAEFSRQRAA